ncbi:glycoside hydrolase family 16 protein [Streptomyces sp. NPDC005483]|uniref:glycoside hydrolase family 16 protein n=1 Tax=Streptomyces sp. NPDC005483 TaxID=3154882 RepID=UPI0033A42F3D
MRGKVHHYMHMTKGNRRRPRLTLAHKLSPLVLAAAIIGAATTAQASQSASTSTGVTVDSLSVAPAVGVGQFTATAKLHSDRYMKVDAVTVAARSVNGSNYDFPGARTARLSPSGNTYTSGSRTFPAGTYTYFVAYKVQGTWHNLAPVKSFTSGGTSPSPAPTPTPTPTATPTPTPTPTPTSTPTQPAPTSADAPLGVPGTWRKVFSDEFSGTTLDSAKWNPNWLGCPTCITKPVNSAEIGAYAPSQVSVSGGSLHLTAIQQQTTASNGTTYPYRSGLVESNGKAQFTYGAFEARIYSPASGTQIANWPAFWTDGQTWPADGEMDVLEGLGGQACYHFHSNAGGPGGCASGNFTGWHTYGAEWKAGSVTYYYDGKQVGQITTGITAQPMYLILNNGVSDQHGGPRLTPADMMVDYVRVWQH